MHMHRGFSITGKKGKLSARVSLLKPTSEGQEPNPKQPINREKKCFFAFLKENQRAVQFSERLLVSGNFSLLDFLIGNMS